MPQENCPSGSTLEFWSMTVAVMRHASIYPYHDSASSRSATAFGDPVLRAIRLQATRTMKSVKKVAAKTPDSTTTPITMRVSAPAPLDSTSGMAPAMVVRPVRRWGGNGSRRFDDGARELPAFVAELIGEFDDEDDAFWRPGRPT